MKMRILLISILALSINVSSGQLIQGTIKPGPAANQIEVWVRPDFMNATQYLFQLQFPIAFPSTAIPTPTGLTVVQDPGFIATFGNNYAQTVYPLANNTAGTVRYYVISLIRGGAGASNPQNWVSGTEYKVLTATFTNTNPGVHPSALAKLADFQDGGSDGQGNFYTVDGNANYYVTANSIGNFYASAGVSTTGGDGSEGFAQTISSIVLPVNLLTFSGYKDGNRNQLRWTTSTEVNNVGFEVQRSLDGVNYSNIGFVNTVANGGNSNVSLNYTFTDNNVTGAKQFYRLRQVDLGGVSRLSTIVILKSGKPTVITIDALFPNPATTVVNLMLSSPVRDKVQMTVTDMSGRMVIQRQLNVETGTNNLPINVSALAAGTYMVRLIDSNGEATTGKFIKQ